MQTDDPQASEPDVLDRARLRFDDITSAVQEERMLSLEDRRFVFIEGAQWEDDWGRQFENTIRVQINKTQRGHDKIINDYRANRFTVNYRPRPGTGADDDTAELLNGLMFADMYRSKGQQALDNAFSEGAAGGMGAWRLCNEYEDDSDADNDHQRIRIEQIVDADQRVFFDLDAKLYDKSDARFAYVMHSMTRHAFEQEYGAERMASWPENMLRQPGMFDWFTPDVIYVAEYYEVTEVKRELRIYNREATGEEFRHWAEDMSDEIAADYEDRGFSKRIRRIMRNRVHKWILSGAEVLEDCGFIAGERIPVVPFYGKRVFIDNVERFKGHVRDAKDPARLYNSQVSQLAEEASLSPREIPIFAPEQMEGLDQHWANMNLERHPYALAHPLRNNEGNIVATGPQAYVKPPDVPPVRAALIQLTAADIAEITNGDDGSMEIKSNVSGEAMDIAASRVDAKSFIYMDNFRLSMHCFGEIYEGMAREVYVEEGREVETMDEEGATETATLHELHTNPVTKVTAKRYDLSAGKFNVVADVSEATATRRDKTVRTMMALATAATGLQDMELGQVALLTALKNMDGEGIDDIQEWAHKKAVSLGLDEMTPEEKAAAAQAEQQPDPQAEAITAQANALNAQAGKLTADTHLSEAKTVQTLADAAKKRAETAAIPREAAAEDANKLMTAA